MSTRPKGYYWVIFDWSRFDRGDRHWEIASWDPKVAGWMMIGSPQIVPQAQEHRVFAAIGRQITDVPSLPIAWEPERKPS